MPHPTRVRLRNHPMCWACWREQRGEDTPYRLVDPVEEACCWCGYMNRSGIYLRATLPDVQCHCGGEG